MSFVSDTLAGVGHAVGSKMPKSLRETMLLRAFGLAKVPMILYCSPVVEQLDEKGCAVRIPLNWRTKNHFRSMYFGVLAVGADCVAGLTAMHHIRESRAKVSLIFKDFKAEFLKRPEGDVVFRCDEGQAVSDLVKQAIASGERVNRALTVLATVPRLSSEVVARFEITLSLKKSRGKGQGPT